MADITFSSSEDHSEVIFSASTPEGEDWMGTPQITMPAGDAKAYREAAEAEGVGGGEVIKKRRKRIAERANILSRVRGAAYVLDGPEHGNLSLIGGGKG